MGSKGWIKRVLPFFATFAVGIFIASFFVSVRPNANCHSRWRMRAEMERLRSENEDLRNENLRLRNNADLDMNIPDIESIPLDAPLPPAPMQHRPPRRDK